MFYVSVYLFTLDFYFMRPGLAQPLALGDQGRGDPGVLGMSLGRCVTPGPGPTEKITGLRESERPGPGGRWWLRDTRLRPRLQARLSSDLSHMDTRRQEGEKISYTF